MQTNNFTITGHIIDRQTDRGIPGLRIEAWDKDLFFDRKPDIFFKVYKGNTLVKSTEGSVLWNVSAGGQGNNNTYGKKMADSIHKVWYQCF